MKKVLLRNLNCAPQRTAITAAKGRAANEGHLGRQPYDSITGGPACSRRPRTDTGGRHSRDRKTKVTPQLVKILRL